MSLRDQVMTQFKRPSGPLGHFVGWIMASRGSNRERSQWTVELLSIKPDDRVLELGCGPGVALEACAARLVSGTVLGLDHSPVMIRQAARRNRTAIAKGRVAVQLGGAEELTDLEPNFCKIFSVNLIQFVPDRAALFSTLLSKLRPGGSVATTYQPRHKNPTRADALAMAESIAATMAKAGFIEIHWDERDFDPPAICVLGRRPG